MFGSKINEKNLCENDSYGKSQYSTMYYYYNIGNIFWFNLLEGNRNTRGIEVFTYIFTYSIPYESFPWFSVYEVAFSIVK